MSDGELSLSPLSEFPNLGVITDIRPEPSSCCDRWSNTSQPKHSTRSSKSSSDEDEAILQLFYSQLANTPMKA